MNRPKERMRAGVAAAGMLLLVAGCAARPEPATSVISTPEDNRRVFQEMVRAMDNVLLEINELERMGGGMRDRVVLVDGRSLLNDDNRLQYLDAVNRDGGRIVTLRASLQTNETILDVLTKNKHSLREVIAIDARPQGAVVVYFDPKMAE